MRDDLDTLKILFTLPGGLPGIDDDPDNPISRSCRSTIKHGNPHKSLLLCFYDDVILNHSGENHRLKWFGAFVISNDNHIVFFPGLSIKIAGVVEARGHSRENFHNIAVDHITLEKNLRKWHFTSQDSRKHLGSGRTACLGEDRYLWFGMSISNSDVLRDVKEQTRYQEEVPSSDSARRGKVFIESRNNIPYNIISLNPSANKHFNNSYLHFGVIVGNKGFSNYIGDSLGIPFNSPFLKEKLSNSLGNIPIKIYRLSFNSKVDIEIVTMCLPGLLKGKVAFTGPSSI